VISLTARCDYGKCISPHLSRVQPDGNEPEERCHNGVNWGMYGMLYRVSQIPKVHDILSQTIWNDTHVGCLPPDVAMSAISDRIAYYSVPSSQQQSLLFEPDAAWWQSSRRVINERTPEETMKAVKEM